MKLAVTDIRISAFNTLCATVDVEVEHGKSIYSACTMEVSLPLEDGKAIKDYDEDLKNKAREVITKMYKETVCSGEAGEAGALLDYLGGKIEPSELGKELLEQIKSTRSNNELEERVATLEKRLSGKRTMRERAVEFYDPDGTLAMRFGDLNQQEKRRGEQTSPDTLKAIYKASKKAAEDLLSNRNIGFSFRMVDTGGKLRITGPGKNISPTEKHRDEIVLTVIRELSKVQHMNRVNDIFKTIGRCMGYLQVAAEIQAEIEMSYASDKGKCLDDIIKAFDRSPLKNLSSDWISPGVKYLKRRLNKEAHTPGVNQESDGSLVVRKADASVALRMAN